MATKTTTKRTTRRKTRPAKKAAVHSIIPRDSPSHRAAILDELWETKPGILGWLSAVNHKNIVRTEVRLGPDLTHLASRLTIAGASLQENQGNLAGWVVDAQHVKPGSLMPNMYIDSKDLQELLTYLQTLH